MKKTIFILVALVTLGQLVTAQITTNLPILKITLNQAIVDTYRASNMEVIDNASGVNSYSDPATQTTNAGIRLRGNATSQSYPKKSYSVETWTGFNISNNTSVMGLPIENDWVLLSAYTDRSLLRSKLALELHDEMDRYAPRMVYCELFIDTVYQGVYLFGEKVKRDTNRLDLSNLRTVDNFGDQLTGGYILQLDDENGAGFTSSYPPPNATNSQQIKYLYELPDNGDITPAQKAYIESYVDSFENALNGANYQDTLLGWRPFGANKAFIDFIIANEVSRNYDAYRVDMYIYKDRNKKMRPGPLWGFDASFANTVNCGSDGTTGFAYDMGASCGTLANLPSFWWSKLMTDTKFVQDLKCRYTKYRYPGDVLDTAHIFMLIDSFASELTQMNASNRNFAKYPIFGMPLINEPMPMSANHAEEVENIKTFVRARLAWLDSQWLDNSCIPLSTKSYAKNHIIKIYPNPATDQISIQSDVNGAMRYELKTISGRVLTRGMSKGGQTNVDLSNYTPGLYLLLVDQNDERYMKKVLVR